MGGSVETWFVNVVMLASSIILACSCVELGWVFVGFGRGLDMVMVVLGMGRGSESISLRERRCSCSTRPLQDGML